MPTLARFIWHKAKLYIMCATVASILSGLCRASLIALVGASLAHQHVSIWWYAVLCTGAPVSAVISELSNLRGINETMFQLLLLLVRRILRLPLQDIERIGSHKLLTILTQDLAVVTSGLQLIPNVMLQCAIIIGCLLYLAWLSIPVFFCVAVPVALGALSFRLAYSFAQRHVEAARVAADAVFQQLDALAGGIKELKLHRARQGSFLQDGIGTAATAYKRHSIIGSTAYSLVANWTQLLFFALMGALLFAAPRLLPGASTLLLTRYGLTLLFLIGPLTALSSSVTGLSGLRASYQRLEDTSHSIFSGEEESDSATFSFDNWKTIRFVDIEMEYDGAGEDSPFHLGPITFEVKRGEILLIAGGNGCGKTTLAKILCGLYLPNAGKVFVDHVPINTINSGLYRELFSAVFADFYLFTRLLGISSSQMEKNLPYYLEQLQLQSRVRVVDGRYSTTALSQGQRKRLALLTACLEDRSIYILDEWAADQDPSFKTVFYRTILPILKRSGKTIVVISHDDTYYDVADRIIRMQDGKIIDNYAPCASEPNKGPE